jgi:hypothetical protein
VLTSSWPHLLQEVSLQEASQALQRDYLKNNRVIDLATHLAEHAQLQQQHQQQQQHLQG